MTTSASRRRVTVAAVVVLLVVTLTAALRALVVVPVRISSASMAPTLVAGDVVLVSRAAPELDELDRWDLVAFADPRNGRRTVKRVVGLPGEEVVILDGVLHIDGEVVEEPWVRPRLVDGYYSRTFRVPVTGVFVLGDNRMNSVDSRDYGPLAPDALEGRVLVIL